MHMRTCVYICVCMYVQHTNTHTRARHIHFHSHTHSHTHTHTHTQRQTDRHKHTTKSVTKQNKQKSCPLIRHRLTLLAGPILARLRLCLQPRHQAMPCGRRLELVEPVEQLQRHLRCRGQPDPHAHLQQPGASEGRREMSRQHNEVQTMLGFLR